MQYLTMSMSASGFTEYCSMNAKYFSNSFGVIILFGIMDCTALLKSEYFSVRMRLGFPLE